MTALIDTFTFPQRFWNRHNKIMFSLYVDDDSTPKKKLSKFHICYALNSFEPSCQVHSKFKSTTTAHLQFIIKIIITSKFAHLLDNSFALGTGGRPTDTHTVL